jgi:hypothetical protein
VGRIDRFLEVNQECPHPCQAARSSRRVLPCREDG